MVVTFSLWSTLRLQLAELVELRMVLAGSVAEETTALIEIQETIITEIPPGGTQAPLDTGAPGDEHPAGDPMLQRIFWKWYTNSKLEQDGRKHIDKSRGCDI